MSDLKKYLKRDLASIFKTKEIVFYEDGYDEDKCNIIVNNLATYDYGLKTSVNGVLTAFTGGKCGFNIDYFNEAVKNADLSKIEINFQRPEDTVNETVSMSFDNYIYIPKKPYRKQNEDKIKTIGEINVTSSSHN